MATVTGTISATNDNFGKVNINVNGKWHSTKKEWWKGPEPEVGQEVSFDDGGKNYIKNFRVTAAGSAPAAPAASGGGGRPAPTGRTFPVAALAPERTINRQNALTNAVAYHKDGGVDVNQIIDTARMFEAYTTGDLDEEEMKAAMAAMGA